MDGRFSEGRNHEIIKLLGIVDEDFVNYKVPSTAIMFPRCTFKCGKENCQNYNVSRKTVDINIDSLCTRYLSNPISRSIVCQGLEPMDSFDELYNLIYHLRVLHKCRDDVVIYTGYNKNEVYDKVSKLSEFENIIVKFGRYIPGEKQHFDEILGVNLASDNQYAERIS